MWWGSHNCNRHVREDGKQAPSGTLHSQTPPPPISFVASDWGRRSLSPFNRKLAVLVGQADVQDQKGQTCPFNPGNPPATTTAAVPSHLTSLSASV